MDSIYLMLKRIHSAISTKAQLKHKKIKQFTNQIKNKDSVNIDKLLIGENRGVNLAGILISFISNPTRIPLTGVLLDSSGHCIAISIYNLTEDSINVNSQLLIPNPKLKQIQLIHNNEVITYRSVVVEIPTTIQINGQPIKQEHRAVTGYSISNN